MRLFYRWQKLRAHEYEFDRELKERTMLALTTQEREIRKQLEDAMNPSDRMPAAAAAVSPTFESNGHTQTNGAKSKLNGTSGRKGKQKK